MAFASWLRTLKVRFERTLTRLSARRPSQGRAPGRLLLERLEERIVPSLFSADNRYFAFSTSNMSSNGHSQVYVLDRQTGTTQEVSVGTDGLEGNNDSDTPSISADGRYIAYESQATNLPGNHPTGMWGSAEEVYIYDRQTGTTQQISGGSAIIDDAQLDTSTSMSADGRYVAIDGLTSIEPDGSVDEVFHSFVYDRQTGTTQQVPIDGGSLWISPDGRYVGSSSDGIQVYDRQTGTLEVGNGAGQGIILNMSADDRYFSYADSQGDDLGFDQIFVYDRENPGSTEQVSLGLNGYEANLNASFSIINADGRYVAFTSRATNLVSGFPGFADVLDPNIPYADQSQWNVFVYDRQTHTTAWVSVAPDGTQGNGNVSLIYNGDISPDGQYISFTSNPTDDLAGEIGTSGVFIEPNPLWTPPPPTVAMFNGTVSIFGTTGNDAIAVSQSGGNLVVQDDSTTAMYPVADVTAVNIWGHGGENNYTIDFGNLPAPVTIYDGGNGNSTLIVNGVTNALTNDITKTRTGIGEGTITWTDDSPDTATETVNYNGVTNQVINANGSQTNYVNDPGDNTIINGGPGTNTIVITATEGSGVVLNGGPGANNYVLDLGSLAGPVTINNNNPRASNSVVINGAPGGNPITLSGNQVTEGDQNITLNAAVTNLTVDVSQSSGVAQITVAGVTNVGTLLLDSKPGDAISVAPPSADAGGPYGITYGDGLTLDASASSDPDHLPLSYSWTINGEPNAATGINPTLSWSQLQALGVTDAGSFTIGVTVNDGHGNVVASAPVTLTVARAMPSFSLSGPPIIEDGTGHTTLSGILNDGALIPTGSVTVTANGVGQVAALGSDGSFSATFATSALGVGLLTIAYSYGGDANFTGASATGVLDVTYGVLTLYNTTKAEQAGSTLPVQIELVNISGQDVSSANVTVTAVGIAPASDPSDVQPAGSPGNSDPGGVFQYQGGRQPYYQFNLQIPDDLTAGSYCFYFTVEGDQMEHSVQFVVK